MRFSKERSALDFLSCVGLCDFSAFVLLEDLKVFFGASSFSDLLLQELFAAAAGSAGMLPIFVLPGTEMDLLSVRVSTVCAAAAGTLRLLVIAFAFVRLLIPSLALSADCVATGEGGNGVALSAGAGPLGGAGCATGAGAAVFGKGG